MCYTIRVLYTLEGTSDKLRVRYNRLQAQCLKHQVHCGVGDIRFSSCVRRKYKWQAHRKPQVHVEDLMHALKIGQVVIGVVLDSAQSRKHIFLTGADSCNRTLDLLFVQAAYKPRGIL
jgi:uncharacterized protein (UPF0548 family)